MSPEGQDGSTRTADAGCRRGSAIRPAVRSAAPRRHRDRTACPRAAIRPASIAAAGHPAPHCAPPGSARRQDRAADRCAASCGARADKLPGTPPRRCRDRGNSATARRWPADARQSARHRSRPVQSSGAALAGRYTRDRPHLVCAAGPGIHQFARDTKRFLEVLARPRCRSRAAAPWSRRTARRSPAGSPWVLRSVAAEVVGSSRSDGPILPS